MKTKRKSLTTGQVAEYLGVTNTTVIRWIDENKLKATRTPGGHRRVPQAHLDEFMKKYNLTPATTPLLGKEKEKRVLIVDDEPPVVEVLRRAIEHMAESYNEEIQIAWAFNGFEAGRLVATFRPHLIFLDLMMPKMDGFDVCYQVKNDPATKDIIVVAITGYGSPENVERILKCGAVKCLIKPVTVEQIQDITREVLGIKKKRV